MSNDTICAIATAPGRGSIGVLRISGKALAGMARDLVCVEPEPRKALFCDFHGEDGEILDRGIALFFPAPNSFTGEDVLELQGHGGRVVLESLRERVIALGARQARPGEFSERAFLNGKIDLAQAEAIADLIDADSRQAARSALRTLTGEFSQRIQSITALLTQQRVLVESAIDFSDSDIEVLQVEQLRQSLADLLERLDRIRERSRQGALLNQGISAVLAGLPNAGKSSLMNRLSGQQTAIVTEIPGTTRDVLSQRILLDDLPLQLIDTAGLRRSADVIEREGVRRARDAIDGADVILLVVDASLFPDCARGLGADELLHVLEPLEDFLEDEEDRADLLRRTCIVLNKIDLLLMAPAAEQACLEDIELPVIRISAKDGSGIELLAAHLKRFVAYEGGEDAFVARARHLEALDEARWQCQSAMDKLTAQAALELIAEDLRLAQAALGRITGEVTSDDLLGEIFSKFCIGK
ncbi:MAG: tRNA uridine-5-carboxymethylaminomethyl(34) synthesis GTPase MnmE [Gammaproteobacteria bacterium]|nr:tRNA uridine-5-carboxymethylaminomethyl(34) synthesis GTPase MnmE [Gammaproteobacteria bacterium]MCY3688797.1 tRNA uridine-5-carboxymethylaminomethyl(34) synthesis GTPase MnmE [Gammaproteobacteria bacterium]